MRRPALFCVLLLAATPAFAQQTAPAPPQQGNAPVTGTGATVPTPAKPPRAARSLPTPTPTPEGANQFASDAAAQAHCPGDAPVWVNPRSKAYHLKGTRYYGHTRTGAYMCRKDADAAGLHGPGSKAPAVSGTKH